MMATQIATHTHGIHPAPETASMRRRGPHPGDILYWVACVGGACLLLFFSAT